MQLCDFCKGKPVSPYVGVHVAQLNAEPTDSALCHVVVMCTYVICQKEQFDTNKIF